MSNIKFKKSLMAVATGVALAGAGMTAANANSLLFPYFSTQGQASSYLLLRSGAITVPTGTTVVGAGTSYQRVTGGNIHYVWNVFPANTALSGGALACTHVDAYGLMTQHDTMFQELSNPTGVTFTDGSTPAFLPPQGTGPVQGFMIVSDIVTPAVGSSTAVGTPGVTGAVGTLNGQMIVADPTSGSLYAYNGIAGADTAEGNFSNIVAKDFNLAWYPQGVTNGGAFSTKWYALAVGAEGDAIAQQANWASNYLDTAGVISYPSANLVTAAVSNVYDNNENPVYSGTPPSLTLGCATTFTPASLLTTTNAGLLGPTGGQMDLSFTVPAASAASGVVVTKIDAVQLGTGVNWTQGGAVLFTQENNANTAVNATLVP